MFAPSAMFGRQNEVESVALRQILAAQQPL